MAQFTAAQLLETQLKTDVIWKDAQVNAFYKAEVEGLRAIRENSAATITPLEDTNKEYQVSVNWITTTSLVVTEGTVNNCDIDGPQLDAAKKLYALDIFPTVSFKVSEQDLKTSIFSKEEVVAKGLLEVLRLLDESLATRAMAKVDSFAGVNAFPGGYATVAGKTPIPIATPAVNVFAYLDQVRILNRMRDAYLIENGSMYQQQVAAAYNAKNLNGQGEQAAFGSMKIYNDLFNMSAAGLTTDALLIGRNAVAFASKSRYPNVPEVLGGKVNQTHYSVPSPALPGVRYDVIYEMKCAAGTIINDSNTMHTWRIMANAGVFLNPTRTAGNTGVLAIDRV